MSEEFYVDKAGERLKNRRSAATAAAHAAIAQLTEEKSPEPVTPEEVVHYISGRKNLSLRLKVWAIGAVGAAMEGFDARPVQHELILSHLRTGRPVETVAEQDDQKFLHTVDALHYHR